MSRQGIKRGVLAVFWNVAVLGPGVSSGARADDASGTKTLTEGPRIYVGGPVALAVVRAFEGARRKLRDPGCQQVLTDFSDPEGRTLRDNLGDEAPAAFLDRLVVRDGEIPKGSGRCRHPAAGAYTVRGSGVIFLCGGNFVRQGPRLQENALIHEMLHSLGLGENPPSSKEISRQVERRCGV